MGYDKLLQRMEAYTAAQMEQYRENYYIEPEYYEKFEVLKGLRDRNGTGVLAGLTEISAVNAKKEVDGKVVPIDGELLYRGYNVFDLVEKLVDQDGYGYEEISYLLLFGELPDAAQLREYAELLEKNRELPTNFVRDVIMKAPSRDIMNSLTRSVLTLAAYDDKAADLSLPNVLRQSIMLTAVLPMIAVYAYHAYNHYERNESMYIHRPEPGASYAGTILHLLRADGTYTPLEEKALDTALVLHMEHGGGNNSTFTTRVVTSSGSDTYAVMAAALCSLKGPRHGGANIKVMEMMEDLRRSVKDLKDEEELAAYLKALLHGEAFDRSGLIYGAGHAVYSKSDPRAIILERNVRELAASKGLMDDYQIYSTVARLAPEIIAQERQIFKGVSVNVDFYSGFLYQMLGIPVELYTPMFATARIIGWSAHRLEELAGGGKIIRPAYRSLVVPRDLA